jgi:hypothetical protein
MKKIFKLGLLSFGWVIAMMSMGGVATAAITNCTIIVSGTGASSGAPVSGLLELTYNDVTGLLTIKITNTSATGSIVGAGFNTPGTRTATSGTVTIQPAGGSMIALNSTGGPYQSGSTGNYDFGIATSTSNGLQSGQPSQGIQVGETATATFMISSPGGITADDFCEALNSSGNAIVLRIQSVGPGGEDSAHAVTITQAPEPTTFLLLGAGLLALGLVRRKQT